MIPVNVWFDHVADLLPRESYCVSRLDLLQDCVEALQALGVEFPPLPIPTRDNIGYSLGNKIYGTVRKSFSQSGCANWAKQSHRRICDLQAALRAEGIK